MRRQLILGSARAFLALALIGCHGGAPGGVGAPCAIDKPCRAAFTCVAGQCQPSDGGLPDSPDLGTDSTDLRTENPVDGPHDVLTPSETGDHPIEAPTEKPDATSDRLDSPPDTAPDRPGDAPRDVAGDSLDGGGHVDMRPDVPLRCDHSQPFSSVTLVGGISSPGTVHYDRSARLSPDELRIFFTGVNLDIFEATRASRDADFNAPVRLSTLKVGDFAFGPSVTGDGMTMFLEADPGGGLTSGIYTSFRPSDDGDWFEPMLFFPLVTATDLTAQGQPYVLPLGDVLYFRAGFEGIVRIFRTARVSGTWGEPKLMLGSFDESEFSPAVAADDRTIYFASSHGKAEEAAADGGVEEPGDFDVWVATRKTTGEAFAAPTRVMGVNTAQGEEPTWISPDGCRLYFQRTVHSTTQSRIYVATRTPK
jgi:hypothetical protein